MVVDVGMENYPVGIDYACRCKWEPGVKGLYQNAVYAAPEFRTQS